MPVILDSGGRDQEDQVRTQPQANSLQDPISKIPFAKKGLLEWLKVKAPSSSPNTKKTKNYRRYLNCIFFFL
jgi:hypothetical protein